MPDLLSYAQVTLGNSKIGCIALLTCTLLITFPLLLTLLYKSERKQAKFHYQLAVYKRDFVIVHFDTTLSDQTQIAGTTWKKLKETAMPEKYQQQSWFFPLKAEERDLLERLRAAQEAQGDTQELQAQPDNTPDNNFKLLSGTGIVTCTEPIADELFQLKIKNSVGLRRTVEILTCQPAKARSRRRGCPCQGTRESGRRGRRQDCETPRWVKVVRGSKLLDFTTEVKVAKEANLGKQHKLSQRQISDIGEYETVDMTDEIASKLSRNIIDLPEFAQFSNILRSGKYLVCRGDQSQADLEGQLTKDYGEWEHSLDQAKRGVLYRKHFSPGDVRVTFEYVRSPRVSVLAQQIQTVDEVFRLRAWSPFSPTHRSVVDDSEEENKDGDALQEEGAPASEEDDLLDAPEEAAACSSIYLLWCNVADYLLAHLSDDSIEVIEDQPSKGGNRSGEIYRSEVEDNMQYARWFRPFIALALFTTIFSGIALCEKDIETSLGKEGHSLEAVLAKTLTIQTSRAQALGIVSLTFTFGLYLVISSIAWCTPTFSLKCLTCLVLGTLQLLAGVYCLLF